MIKFARPFFVVGCALSLMLAAGCTEKTTGTPGSPASSDNSVAGGSSSTPPSGEGNIPKVSRPLPNISSYVDKPCSLVPSSLVTQLGYSNPEATDPSGAIGPGCGWVDIRTAKTRNFAIAIGISNGRGNGGLAKIYSLNGSLFGFVEPTEVSGYPAAYADGSDRRPGGKCEVYVGVTDNVAFSVGVDGYQNQQDSCGTAQQIAASVISTLQGGS